MHDRQIPHHFLIMIIFVLLILALRHGTRGRALVDGNYGKYTIPSPGPPVTQNRGNQFGNPELKSPDPKNQDSRNQFQAHPLTSVKYGCYTFGCILLVIRVCLSVYYRDYCGLS